MEQTRRHIAYLDYLRIGGAMAVVYMHTAAEGLRGEVGLGWHAMNCLTSLAFTAVPLFFMISGFLLLSDPKTLQVGRLLRRRLPRLIAPLAFWSAFCVLFNAYTASYDISAFAEELFGALYEPVQQPLWFLYTLIPLYLLSPLLCGGVQTLSQRDGRRYISALTALVSLRYMLAALLPKRFAHYLALDLIGRLQILGGYLLLFLLGYYLGTLERRINDRLLLLAALATYAVILLGTWRLTLRDGSYNAAFQNQSAGFEVLLASCLFLLAKQNADKDCTLLHRIPAAPLCFPVYLMHGPVLSIFYHYGIYPIRFRSVVLYTVLNLVLCYFGAKTLATIKPLCFLTTGIPYERACASCNWVYTFRRLRAADER